MKIDIQPNLLQFMVQPTVNDPEIIDDVVREYICCLMELD